MPRTNRLDKQVRMNNRFGATVRQSAMALMVAVMGLAGNASATLFDRGGGLIYDDVLNITWLQDANYAQTSGFDADGLMNWDNAKAWAAGLSYFDSVRNVTWTDWRLPYASVIAGQGGSVPRFTTLPEFSPACSGLPGGEVACRDNEMGYMYYYDLGGTVLQNKTGNQTAVGGQAHGHSARLLVRHGV